MPKTIEISETTYNRLLQVMGPDDTSDSAISGLLDLKLHNQSGSQVYAEEVPSLNNTLEFMGFQVPNFRFTKLLRAKINGREIARPNWNKVKEEIIKEAIKAGADIKNIGLPGFVEGKLENNGFKFIEEINISLQGQDSNDAWRSIMLTAEYTGIKASVVCEWLKKEGADYPGLRAKITSN